MTENPMSHKRKVAIIGSGNIGTDLMIKVLRQGQRLEMAAMVGIDPASDGLARARSLGVPTTAEGVEGLLAMPGFDQIGIVFDATSAQEAANAAQEDATQALADAATAQGDATQALADSAAAQATADAALPKAGGTMTGAITFSGTQPTATTTTAGIVVLETSVTSTDTTKAATPSSVKTAYDQIGRAHV
jgi:acetaldehyde dehydrogenase (acetylating)